MPETPIRTEGGVHPFDFDELLGIRAAVSTWEQAGGDEVDPEENINLAAYAAAVMPAMADKIEQLRRLLDVREQQMRAYGTVLARRAAVAEDLALQLRFDMDALAQVGIDTRPPDPLTRHIATESRLAREANGR